VGQAEAAVVLQGGAGVEAAWRWCGALCVRVCRGPAVVGTEEGRPFCGLPLQSPKVPRVAIPGKLFSIIYFIIC
jgi:hypothetical protein